MKIKQMTKIELKFKIYNLKIILVLKYELWGPKYMMNEHMNESINIKLLL